MNALEKAELTASIRHIARFLKSGIQITILKSRIRLAEKPKKKNKRNCKAF